MPASASSATLPETLIPPGLSSRASLLLLGLMAAAICGWILLLPLFPTQDGPMHLYFVHILDALLFHRDPGILPQFYTVKHVLPPYALYYYLLLGLNHFMPLVRADQTVVCVYVISFLFGFRYLAASLGPFGNTIALLAGPLALNWPLGMGFVNFCLSLSFSLWALGLWCRAAQSTGTQQNRIRLAGFVALCFVMMLTHPVPLAATLGFCVVELLVRSRSRTRSRAAQTAPLLPAAVAFALGASSMFYVLAFKGAHSLQQHHDQARYLMAVLENAMNFYMLRTLTCFAGHSLGDTVYKACFVLMLPVAAGMVLRDRRSTSARDYRSSLASIWLGVGLGLLALLPWLPADLNNSHLFTARLVILAWIAVLTAASAVRRAVLTRTIVGFSLALTAWTLFIAVRRIDPIAQDIAQLERGTPGIDRNIVLMLQSQTYNKTDRLSYDPYFWSPVRLLRRSGSILFNTPWLDLAIIPIGAQPGMPTGKVDSYAMESPRDLRQDLLDSAADRRLFADRVNAVIVSDGPGRTPGPDPLVPLDPAEAGAWTCGARPLLELCVETGSAR